MRNKLVALSMTIFALMAARVSVAEMSSVKLRATVKAYDEKTVTLQLHKRTVRIPRSIVTEKTLRIGAPVFVTFRGDQIDYLFAPDSPDSSTERSPASTEHK